MTKSILIPRIFAVLAAISLVGAIAMATLLPAGMNLRDALDMLDENLPGRLSRLLAGPLWRHVAVPFLARPSWMVPLCLGLICTGGAVTARSQTEAAGNQKRS